MNRIEVYPIGRIRNQEDEVKIILDAGYREGLKGLQGHSHVQVLWWADGCDNEEDRRVLTEKKTYRKGPDEIGFFALRSPERPNPIMVSNSGIAYVDEENGVVGLYYIDANDHTAVLDLKPYTPSIDRVEFSSSPEWCAHWPGSYEESGSFDWEAEFNFYKDRFL